MKKNLLQFVLFILFLGASSVYGQNNAILSGTVKDATTGEILVGADVYLKGTSIGGVSDVNGKYEIRSIPAGNYTVQVTYITYEDFTKEIELSPGDHIKLNIKLQYSGGVGLEEVVVTAQAKGQVRAINKQLQSSVIKNVVSSDRIQELPDANAAESVGRLPGVSVIRSGGEGEKVVIRGMSPKYNKVMIDGVEVASTDSYDRSVSMSAISSYSLDGIEVVKSNTADLDGDFVGGMVNFTLKTADEGFHVDIVAQGSFNQLKSSFKNYLFVASVGDRFFNNKLGIFAMANFESRIRSANERNIETWRVTQPGGDLDMPIHLWIAKLGLSDVDRVRKRKGGTLVFDYKLNNGSIAFKNFVSFGEDIVQNYGQRYDVDGKSIDFSTQDRNSDVITINNLLKYDQQFGVFNVGGYLSHSYSEGKTPNDLTFYFKQTAASDAMQSIPTYDPSLDPDDVMSYANFKEDATLSDQFIRSDDISKQRQYEAALDLEWTFSISKQFSGAIKFGGKYRNRTKSYDINRVYGILDPGTAGGRINDRIVNEFPNFVPYVDNQSPPYSYIPYSGYINRDYSHGEFLKGKYGDMGSVANIPLMHDVADFVADSVDPTYIQFYHPDVPESHKDDYHGFENLYAGYIMATLKITSMIDFIPGVRYEQNNTSYTGPHGDERAAGINRDQYPYFDTTTTRQNGFFLPMIQMKIKPLSWLQIHLGYTQTLSRPDYNLLVPRRHIDKYTVYLNKYDLKPERATNYDINVSAHQNYIGLFSVGLFAKNLTNKIFYAPTKRILDNKDYGLEPELQGMNIVTQYNDSGIVKIRGIELEWQTSFWYLPGALKGLVLNINYTHVISEARYPYSWLEVIPGSGWDPDILIIHDTSYVDRLIDQPNHILNVTLGYDYKGFSTRVSMLYNSNVFSGNSMFWEERSYTSDYMRFDLSLKQDLPVKGLQAFLNMQNITGTIDKTYQRSLSYPTYLQSYGMTFDLGLRWRL